MTIPVYDLVSFLMKAKAFKRQEDFADWFEVDQSTVSRWRNSKRKPLKVDSDTYDRLLTAAQELSETHGFNLPSDLGTNDQEVSLSGYVGAGAVVLKIEHDTVTVTLEMVRVPKGWGEVEAFKVRGDSMYPRYQDGDILCCTNVQRNLEDLIGKECLVRTADGRHLVKFLEPGSRPGHYTLNSLNASPLYDQEVVEAKKVEFVQRA